ncbi:Coiled-coil-helix-coiled-coil-helix domain-containing protein 7 [Orchesella cincta]|uniref:Coiled-coil-helix-coiled-coil-helix domain-containing protein 7 n=1 Tax=Orchesella cincta TaxID=48709 RepID=A0A1D2MRU1_ORCCI|nr:Coiled-coil-helix-coiled-coil-helix domain-containing protein 7 [Orchesella cincta]
MFENSADLPKSTNKEERRLIVETASKQTSELNNPCLREQNLSYKCLSDNNYNKDKCIETFANYKACKEFWNKVQADRRMRGIRPSMPRPNERETIKAEYMAKFHSR